MKSREITVWLVLGQAVVALELGLLLVLIGDVVRVQAMSSTKKFNRKGPRVVTPSSASPAEIVTEWASLGENNLLENKPLSRSVFCGPPESCLGIAPDIVYRQRSTNTQLVGLHNLQAAAEQWEQDFQTDRGDVKFQVERVSAITDPSSVLVKWTITWIPPTDDWLVALGKTMGAELDYRSYTHMFRQPSTFSYRAVIQLFLDAIQTGVLRIPLACIQGTSTLRFQTDEDDKDNLLLCSIEEDLSYSQDLSRGALQNRKCAQDLRLFLETGRRPPDVTPDAWDDRVVESFAWSSVPGMGALDIEEESDGRIVALLFLGASASILFLFASFLAPELLGQPLFGPPSYIVPPDELNSIY